MRIQCSIQNFPEECVLGVLQHGQVFIRYCVSVLLEEPFDIVRDIVGVMSDSEARIAEAGLLEDLCMLGLAEFRMQLRDERGVGTGWQARLFVQKGNDTKFAFDKVNGRLIVREVDKFPVDLLGEVLFLLELEDVGIELLLELFVGIIDTELLERVLL